MKKLIYSLALAGLALATMPTPADAVPAKPTPLKITLSDGTELTVRLHGDESFHFFTTEDNYLISEGADGQYYYVSQNLTPSEYVVTEISQRTPEVDRFLSTINREAQWEVNQSKITRLFSRDYQKNNLPAKAYPTHGNQKGLVILVEYQDVKFTVDDPKQAFHDLLNKEGYDKNGSLGSAADYYRICSNNEFTPQFDVYGPVTLPNKMSYYGGNDYMGNDKAPEQMVIDACKLLDDEIDFTEYDRDGDGFVDNVYVFYAGKGEANSGIKDTVWPHSWDILYGAGKTVKLDGVQLNHYACSNEMNGSNIMEGIGTFCHEFNHVLGFPDLYATTYTNSFTPGTWTIMDQGSYNNDGHTPPYMTAYERYFLDWLEPTEIGLNETEDLELESISNHRAFIIRTNKENEYFILENRQKEGWDKYLLGHGMLIWHIDYNQSVWDRNVVNNTPTHQYVDIEEADNTRTTMSIPGDAFPGTKKVTSFTDTTSPSMKTWNNSPVNKPITNITEENGIIKFTIKNTATGIADVASETGLQIAYVDGGTVVCNNSGHAVHAAVYNDAGTLLRRIVLEEGANRIGDDLPKGMYILTAEGQSYKLLR